MIEAVPSLRKLYDKIVEASCTVAGLDGKCRRRLEDPDPNPAIRSSIQRARSRLLLLAHVVEILQKWKTQAWCLVAMQSRRCGGEPCRRGCRSGCHVGDGSVM